MIYVVVTPGRQPGRFMPDVLGPFDTQEEANRVAQQLADTTGETAIVRPIMAAWTD